MTAVSEPDFDIRTATAGRTAVVLSVGASLLAIPQAFVVGDLVAVLVVGPGFGLTGFDAPVLIAALAAVGVLRLLVDAAASRSAAEDAIRFKRALRGRWLETMAGWSPVAGDRPSTGEVASTLVDRVETLDPLFTRYALARARMAVLPPAIVIAVLPVSWVVALLFLVAGPIIPVLMSLIGAKARDLGRKQIDETASLTGLLLDRVRGLSTIRALGAGERIAADIGATGERLRRRTMAVLAVAFLSSAVLEFFASVGIALSAIFVGFRLLGWIDYGGDFTLAGGVAMLMLAPEFFQPLRDFAGAYHDRATALSLADRADATFAATLPRMPAAAMAQAGDARSEPPAVTVSALSVDPPAGKPGRRLLDRVSLRVEAGERVAVVGPSGAGKSMLLLAIAGLVEPEEGDVRIGASHAGTGEAARAAIGWIGQEPYIVHGSVLANLDPGGAGRVTRAAADAALRAVGLSDVIGRMPRGVLTPLGETGAGLSRGELRRVTIARALVGGGGLLLADEPTADLDEATAADVTGALLAAARGRTLVVATHDAGLIARMDRIVRIEAGRLVEATT